jgi:competence protein ComEC
MRGLGLAAFFIELVEPEALVEPGFQMLFAATMALVAGQRPWRNPMGRRAVAGH